MPSGNDPSRDLRLAAGLIAALTAWRLAALAFDGTDLWVDEAQYWLWGQSPDWGYFSKPPMIGWLSRLVTDLAGSDAIFWIRAPGAVLHATTAFILGAAAGRVFGGRTGAWTAAIYVTAPFVALGSWLYSTDSVMLVFYAAGIYAALRLSEGRSPGWALALGVATGLGFLSKYAMLYLPLTLAVAAAATPRARIAWRDAILAAGVALVVAAPNLVWNLSNDAQTIRHVATTNARVGDTDMDLVRAIRFLAEQFAVFGPVLFAAWAVAVARAVTGGPPVARMLAWLSLPIVAALAVQAALSQAYANWAVTAYAAGSILATAWLMDRPRIRTVALGINLLVAVLFPLLFIFAQDVRLPDGRLLAARYIGPRALSQDIGRVALREGATGVAADERGVLADLFHTLRDEPLTIHALAGDGRPTSFYEVRHALTADVEGRLVFVTRSGAPQCAGAPVETIRPAEGIYAGRAYDIYLTDADCLLR